jgi:CHAT domain-containing protein/tetratricopeptide (TPR) repeat protein
MKNNSLHVIIFTMFLVMSPLIGLFSVKAETKIYIMKASNDLSSEANHPSNLGNQQKLIKQLKESLQVLFEQLKTYKALRRPKEEAIILSNIGSVYSDLGEKERALDFFAQALSISNSIGDQQMIANILGITSSVYSTLGDKQKALKYLSQALPIFKSVGDQKNEGLVLNNIGLVYSDLSEWQKALGYYSQALPILKSIGDQKGEGLALNNIGFAYSNLGEKEKALGYYSQALPILKSIGDQKSEGLVLSNIGFVYSNLSEWQKALGYYTQALPIFTAFNDQKGIANILNNIGLVYDALGVKEKALNYYFQSQLTSKSIGDQEGVAKTLNNIGFVYGSLGVKEKALDYYSQALPIFKSIGDQKGVAAILNNIGLVYSDLSEWQKALGYYSQALPILESIGDQEGVAKTLNNIGLIYGYLGEREKAVDYYSQALPIFKSIGDQKGTAILLDNLGETFALQKRPELSIFFLKQAVNTTQSLKENISELPKSIQKTFANSSANSYRILARLLLEQGRVLEAQQVLDLLKVEEIDDYFGDSKRGDTRTQQDVIYLRPEQQLLDKYNQRMKSAIQIGQERKQLQTLSQSGQTLTLSQQKRLTELDRLQTDVKGLFNQFINSPEVQQLTAQLTRSGQEQISLNVFDKLRKNLSKLGNAALIYPLVLDERIELIITTPDSPPLRRTVKIQRAQLNQAIINFRDVLESPKLDPKPSAQNLYSLLIQPLENDLKQANIKTIIYAPDGPLRYIPLAALYDGKQWIAERFSVNNITAVSLSDLSTSQPSALRVLAGAFANEKLSYKIHVGQQTSVYHGLPFAGKEVNALAATIPGTEKRIDKAFSLKALKPSFPQYNVLHFATHAAFFPGRPEDSFILFGDGERATLRSIEDWSLSGVDLVVLSACESGLGIESSPNNPKPDKSKLGSGAEILGLGYQIQHSGALATMASLWSVDDGGTQSLMSAFYTLLQKGSITKAEALRQAQVILISGKGVSQNGIKNLTHPHYWAPFILIGNGL